MSLPPPHQPGRPASSDERRRFAIPRRSTRGPLDPDADDPLASSPPTTAQARSPAAPPQRVLSPSRAHSSPRSPRHHVGVSAVDMPSKDFSFLQDPQAYHVLPANNVPPPFLNAPNVPSVSSPVDTLLFTGHYRLAAIAAARNILTASPSDYESLLHLLNVRLACLCLISEHALAAHESKVLGDLNSTFYRHPFTNAHLVPWDLRLLVVRLAALGYGEWRKGIMGYYELARECRENITKTDSADEKKIWRTRLRDCGIRVANVLVEMGDFEGAGRHLGTLSASGNDMDIAQVRDILLMETLVWLRVGDILAARRCLASAASDTPEDLLDGSLQALVYLANSEYTAAVSAFRDLHVKYPSDAMITQNLAVSLLYTGHIAEAKELLSALVEESPPFHSLVFNLSTVFELCTERNRDKKVALAESLARKKGDGSVGWEISSVDFKL